MTLPPILKVIFDFYQVSHLSNRTLSAIAISLNQRRVGFEPRLFFRRLPKLRLVNGLWAKRCEKRDEVSTGSGSDRVSFRQTRPWGGSDPGATTSSTDS